MSGNALAASSTLDPLTGFGDRAALIERLTAATHLTSESVVLAVFGLEGLDELEASEGAARRDEAVARLAEEFAGAVGSRGVCYTPRRREFCAVFELPLMTVLPILAAAAIGLRREGAILLIKAAFGTAILPDQAESAGQALIVADQSLNQARRTQASRAA